MNGFKIMSNEFVKSISQNGFIVSRETIDANTIIIKLDSMVKIQSDMLPPIVITDVIQKGIFEYMGHFLFQNLNKRVGIFLTKVDMVFVFTDDFDEEGDENKCVLDFKLFG